MTGEEGENGLRRMEEIGGLGDGDGTAGEAGGIELCVG